MSCTWSRYNLKEREWVGPAHMWGHHRSQCEYIGEATTPGWASYHLPDSKDSRKERHACSDFGTDGPYQPYLGPRRPSSRSRQRWPQGRCVTFCHNRGNATMSMCGGDGTQGFTCGIAHTSARDPGMHRCRTSMPAAWKACGP